MITIENPIINTNNISEKKRAIKGNLILNFYILYKILNEKNGVLLKRSEIFIWKIGHLPET
jgi:hypothetical protein